MKSKDTFFYLKFLLSPIIFPILAWVSFSNKGWLAYSGILFVFVLVPLIDLIIPPSKDNPESKEAEAKLIENKFFDLMLWSILIIQLLILSSFIYTVYHFGEQVSQITLIGWILTMGMCCGVLGINVGHELGHRMNSWQRFIGKACLWTSLRMSFYIEHNYGHHVTVSTDEDPASARKYEIVWLFIPKSIFLSWVSAWKIQLKLLKQKQISFFSIKNDMFYFTLIQWASIFAAFSLGTIVGIAYLSACIIGWTLLEMTNYIEHYGLRRHRKENGQYERTMPIHSWNSNHSFSGATLFHLSRHSDHHYIASRPYQILRNFETVPNMPTGYAGMIVLSCIPPLFFAIMHPMLKSIENLPKDGINQN
ncbi:MAG: alkane 1-monooxygenase [Chitinophagales bacterium]|jgi:alkane 1-monooxygenase|nr:alkane 1-monooxygenase [Chitinophagales bacterium]